MTPVFRPALKPMVTPTRRKSFAPSSTRQNKIEFIRVMSPTSSAGRWIFRSRAPSSRRPFREGKGFDGSSVEGFVRIEESDLIIKTGSRNLPAPALGLSGIRSGTTWREGLMFGDILTPDGRPYSGDSRYVLKRALARASSEFGVDAFNVAPNLKFFIFGSDKEPEPLDDGGYFFSGRHGELRKEIQILLKKMGVRSEYDHHESPTASMKSTSNTPAPSRWPISA